MPKHKFSNYASNYKAFAHLAIYKELEFNY